jgi:hypothetical protein
MYGGFGGRANWGLVLGVVGLFAATPALSADLGGDCCADLEERVAELEATTARKGNRKVSLTVSGWVNEAVFWWDDGTEKNVYVGTNLIEQSRVRFVGEAKIDKDWSAGYVLELGVQGSPSNQWNQFSSNSTNINPEHVASHPLFMILRACISLLTRDTRISSQGGVRRSLKRLRNQSVMPEENPT